MSPTQRSPAELFGEVLREMRLKRGLSQEALAHACQLHRTYISSLERAKNSPTLDTLFVLAGALEVPPSDLVRRVEKRGGH